MNLVRRFNIVLIFSLLLIAGNVYGADSDGDIVPDETDNCATVANMDQTDSDFDGVGDACEDIDGDGVQLPEDNCPSVPNPEQTDSDSDGEGDACEPPPPVDNDGDGVVDESDNCINTSNPDQKDLDADDLGDACDDDDDDDGIPDSQDAYPLDSSVS